MRYNHELDGWQWRFASMAQVFYSTSIEVHKEYQVKLDVESHEPTCRVGLIVCLQSQLKVSRLSTLSR